jgi:hypothetical protein
MDTVGPRRIQTVIDVDAPVFAGELGSFLHLLEYVYVTVIGDRLSRTLYESGVTQFFDSAAAGQPISDSSLEGAEQGLRRVWEQLPQIADEQCGFDWADSERIRLEKLSMNSPIELISVSLPIAFTVAAIFSGGQIKLPGFECRLPPLGVGIAYLREALDVRPSRKKLPPQTLHESVQRHG